MLKRADSAAFMPGVWVFPGGSLDPADGDGDAAYRSCAIRELGEEAAIELGDEDELVLFSRWITPEAISTRFDAWFYLALAPAHTPPRPDGVETVEAAWFQPTAALDAHRTGQLVLAFPTVSQLESLLPFSSSEEAIAAHREREVEPILPKVVGDGGDKRVVLPSDPDYPA